MAEVHEVREVREVPVEVRRSSPGALLGMFILGMIFAAILGFAAAWTTGMIHSSQHPFAINWSGGKVVFGDVNAPTVTVHREHA